jgi:hypothetical protein
LGTVVHFGFRSRICPSSQHIVPLHKVRDREIPVVFVQMDQDLGFSCMAAVPNVVPICPLIKPLGKNAYRRQLPLILAHALTIHSVQGITASNGVVLEPAKGKGFTYGLNYVACSRPQSLEELHIVGALTAEHFSIPKTISKKIKQEYYRLRNIKPAL